MASVIVTGGAAGFAQEIETGRHRLGADEPLEAGGSDQGPGMLDRIANRCPVHRTLVSEIDIRTRLA